MCIPDCNAISVFAKLIDNEIGGSFEILVDESYDITQSYGTNHMDAANLSLGSYGFIDPKDERYIETVKKTEKELCSNGLL